MPNESEDKLPALNSFSAWFKVLGVFAALILINIVAFMVSYGFGVIITLPLTILMAFLLLRDMMPRHRLPPGRPTGGIFP